MGAAGKGKERKIAYKMGKKVLKMHLFELKISKLFAGGGGRRLSGEGKIAYNTGQKGLKKASFLVLNSNIFREGPLPSGERKKEENCIDAPDNHTEMSLIQV